MLIYVEGLDLCWKTTLIDKISKVFPEIVIRKTDRRFLPRDSKIESREIIRNHYLKALDEIELDLKKGKNVVLDRFFLSEIVYWKIKRGYSNRETEEKYKLVLEKLEKIDKKYWFHLIFLYDSIESIMERFKRDGDDYLEKKEEFIDIAKEYIKEVEKIEKRFRVKKHNIFKGIWLWDYIINNVFLYNYEYKRNG